MDLKVASPTLTVPWLCLLKVEASLEKSTETLMFVPMTCILMISARLRAMQLTEAGNPQPWAQTCMYLCTWAIVTQFVLQLVSPADEEDIYHPA